MLESLEELKALDEEAYWQKLAEAAKRDYWIYINDVVGSRQFDEWLHGEEIGDFLKDCHESGDAGLLLAPRSHGKSTYVTIPLPAWWLAHDPTTPTMIANAREDKAGKMIRACASIIERNKRYQACFPNIRPSQKWGEGGYTIDMELAMGGEVSVDRIDNSISCYSVKSNVTGSHIPGGMILDDLINFIIASSPVELQNVESFVRELMNCLDPGAPLLVAGTRWVFTDFYGQIIDGDVIGPNNRPFKVLKLGVTDKDGDMIWPVRTYVDMRGTPRVSGYSFEWLAAQKKNQREKFSALYYNEPQLDEDRQFDISAISTFSRIADLPFELGGVGALIVESGAQQGAALMYPLIKAKRESQLKVRVVEVSQRKMDKHDHIRSVLQPLVNDFRLHIHHDIWEGKTGLGQEIRDFDKGRDDCLDALKWLALNVRDTKEGERPQVFIAIDPAFTVSTSADFTAIIAGCMYREDLYVLEQMHFRSDRTDVIVRKLFDMAKRFSAGGAHRRRDRYFIGHVSSGHPEYGKSKFYTPGPADDFQWDEPPHYDNSKRGN